jgi:hypothetical protein
MSVEELVQLISDDLTASGSLSLNLNTPEIERIIKYESEFLYRTYREMSELSWTILAPYLFRTAEFKTTRTIQLPPCVLGISEFREINDGGRLFGINDRDLSLDRVMLSDIFLNPMSSDVFVGRTISWSWYDLSRSFTMTHIRYKFNVNTHRIQVEGRNPNQPVLLQAFVKIEPSALYDDYYAQRWFICRCKRQLNRVLKTFTTNLIGGVTISDLYETQGKEEEDQLRSYFLSEDPADWFIMTS